MSDPERVSRLDQVARITQAVSGLSIIVGIVVAMAQIRHAGQEMKLQALPSIRELIKQDDDIRKEMGQFLQSYDQKQFNELLSQHSDAEQAYYSPELATVRDVGHHYEQMGALLRTGYIDFDLIYEVVPFPDAFWDETEPLRDACRKNWSNGKGLPDFWRNFAYLRKRYCEKRASEGQKCST